MRGTRGRTTGLASAEPVDAWRRAGVGKGMALIVREYGSFTLLATVRARALVG